MTNINHKKQRYVKLLKLKYVEKKFLTSNENAELTEYLYILSMSLYWETKDQYVDLLQQFLFGKINVVTFYNDFRDHCYSNNKVYESLKANFILLSPHKKSKEFAELMDEILMYCVSYSEIFELELPKEKRNSHELNFRNFMEKIYVKTQKLLNED